MDLSTLFAVRPTSNWTSTLQNATNATPLVKANALVPQPQTASTGSMTAPPPRPNAPKDTPSMDKTNADRTTKFGGNSTPQLGTPQPQQSSSLARSGHGALGIPNQSRSIFYQQMGLLSRHLVGQGRIVTSKQQYGMMHVGEGIMM